MITIRVIYTSGATGLMPLIVLKSDNPDEDDYPYFVSEIPELVDSMCFMGDFTQLNLTTEYMTPDTDIHITRQKR